MGTRIAEAACHSIEEGSCEHMKVRMTRRSSKRYFQDLNWEFVVIDSPNVNAFVVPGGKVVVFTGIVNATLRDCLENVGLIRLLRSVDELAAVLSHEVAHIVARHSVISRNGKLIQNCNLGRTFHGGWYDGHGSGTTSKKSCLPFLWI